MALNGRDNGTGGMETCRVKAWARDWIVSCNALLNMLRLCFSTVRCLLKTDYQSLQIGSQSSTKSSMLCSFR